MVIVTKYEFDALVQALDPKMPAASRQSLAEEYARLLIMAEEARRRGIDQLPELQTMLKFSTLQVLATRLVREISAKPAQVSAADVEVYFRDHLADYQEVSLSRIFVPAKPNDTIQSSTEAVARAEVLHKRAVNGEDFAALQREITGEPRPGEAAPKIRIGPVPCLSLPEVLRSVCDLEQGEISAVHADTSGYFICRLESRRIRELDEVRDEIRATLERERTDYEIENVSRPVSLQLDERYFGKRPNSVLAHKHGVHMPAPNTAGPPSGTHLH